MKTFLQICNKMSVDYHLLNLLPVYFMNAGVTDVVICSGSRSAPLALSFFRYSQINCHQVIDERSAGYIALGMAQVSKKPVAIIVTSGTAVVNLFPAVAEAYYSHTPMIVLTADRPSHQLNRYEGQSMMQENVFGSHALYQFQAPTNWNKSTKDYFEEKLCIALETCDGLRKGPIHINFPFEEPFYPESEDEFCYPEITISKKNIPNKFICNPIKQISQENKIIYIAGKDDRNIELEKIIEGLGIPVFADITSNFYSLNNIANFESIIRNSNFSIPPPNIIISSGRGLVSKILKKYIQQFKGIQHIYISEQGEIKEPTSTASEIYTGSRIDFFRQLSGFAANYLEEWKALSQKVQSGIAKLISEAPFSEFSVASKLFDLIPTSSYIHLGNSMPVRWGQIFNHSPQTIFCNRGVSGIDGATSSAVGASMINTKKQILITGDISFFYDINALWQEQLPSNLKIIIINNNGGGIFRLIDGARSIPENEKLLVMSRKRNLQKTVESFDIPYYFANSFENFEKMFDEFLSTSGASVLEIETIAQINSTVFELYRQLVF